MKKTILLSTIFLWSALLSYGQWIYNYLPEARSRMGVAVLGSKAYFAGGVNNDNQPLSAIEVYDTKQEAWDPNLSLNLSVPRAHPAGVAAGTRIFFAGGADPATANMFSEVDIWDTVSKTWTYTQLSVPRVFLSAVTNGGKVLFAGGNNLLGSSYDMVDIYDMATEQWTTNTLSQARSGMGSAVLGDLAFFAGGYLDETASVTDRVDIYHFSTGTWTTAALSQARGFLSAVTVRNKVMFTGGTTINNEPTGRVDIYDAVTGTWDTASLSVPRALFPDPSSAVLNNRKAYFTSGGHFDLYNHDWNTDFNVIDIYDDSTGTWSTDSLSHSLLLQTVGGVGSYLVVAGGAASPEWNFSNKVEIYIDNDIWSGINKHRGNENVFKIYPNPGSGKIHLNIEDDHNKSLQAKVFDMQGRLVFTQFLQSNEREMNLQLQAGVYLLRAMADDAVYSGLITIQ
jgi:hypothetical protein